MEGWRVVHLLDQSILVKLGPQCLMDCMSNQLFNSLAVKMAIIAGISGFAGLLLLLFCVSKIRRVSLYLDSITHHDCHGFLITSNTAFADIHGKY